MSPAPRLVLVVYDRRTGESEVEDLGTDAAAAMETFTNREHGTAGNDDIEVALLGSSSLDTLRRTHSSYFGAAGELSRLIAAAGR